MDESHMTGELIGLILAGGRSSRMGTDKRYLKVHELPQVEFLFRAMRAAGLPVYTSCKQEDAVQEQLIPIFDAVDVPGPLAGILTALQHYPDKAVLAVAVDMPGVNTASINNLIQARKMEVLATCYFNSERDQPEPLFTIWEPGCLPALLEQTKNRNFSPLDFLKTHPVNLVTISDPMVFINLNTPEDLEGFENTPDR